FFLLSHAPLSPLFPYTTLFRSIFVELFCLAKSLHPFAQRRLNFGVRAALEHDFKSFPVFLSNGCLFLLHRNGLRRSSSKGDDDKDRKSTRLNSSHVKISYAVFC